MSERIEARRDISGNRLAKGKFDFGERSRDCDKARRKQEEKQRASRTSIRVADLSRGRATTTTQCPPIPRKLVDWWLARSPRSLFSPSPGDRTAMRGWRFFLLRKENREGERACSASAPESLAEILGAGVLQARFSSVVVGGRERKMPEKRG
ncbi:hypothetical protein K0M31_006390 [Melipona bicolor]|uniref:Uncharacterized protein n=1 Tax=Melipona bicolor TaxID=60889 RepID=A0AA40KLR7_9HYME|nr:hypothetical protein K0M31_006390 [Melipona bicolor]